MATQIFHKRKGKGEIWLTVNDRRGVTVREQHTRSDGFDLESTYYTVAQAKKLWPRYAAEIEAAIRAIVIPKPAV